MKSRVKRHEVIQPTDQNIRLIALTQQLEAIVDAEDFAWLNAYNWWAAKRNRGHGFNVATKINGDGRRRNLYMSRLLMGLKYDDKREVDHRNGNPLDNRKSNLRICSHAKNTLNVYTRRRPVSNPYKGVHRTTQGWKTVITIGTFSTAEEAATAYNEAALYFHGEFAVTRRR